MGTLNCVFLSGYVVRDAETRFIGTGTPLCSFSIGVPRSYQQAGGWVKKPSFVDCKVWGELAERVSIQLHKGTEVAIQGRLEQERWQSPEGNARSRLVVVADRIEVLGQPKTSRHAESGNDVPF